jgi:hypothetical protein
MGRRERDEKRKAQLKARRRAEKHAGKRSTQEAAEVADLEARLAVGAPPAGTNPLALEAPPPGSYAGARTFEELPLSRATRDALRAAKFTQLTAIQRAALPHALAGRDVLGAAKTGSGKTLCFLIPVGLRRGGAVARRGGAVAGAAAGCGRGPGKMGAPRRRQEGPRPATTYPARALPSPSPSQLVELLFRRRWGKLDGLGGLVLTPTRELAMQVGGPSSGGAAHQGYSCARCCGRGCCCNA